MAQGKRSKDRPGPGPEAETDSPDATAFPGGLAGLASEASGPAGELLAGMGFELCGVEIAGCGEGKVLRFTVDRAPAGLPEGPWRGSGVTLDDCAGISDALSALLDDLWPGDGPRYTLEVSSPGLDRPLAGERDLLRFSGSLAKLKIRRGGRTLSVTGRLRCSPGSFEIVPPAPRRRPGGPRPGPPPEPVAFEWGEVAVARLVPEI
jgi:ribosome maturation factor RimP